MSDGFGDVAKIWERPEFAGLSPAERQRLQRAGQTIGTFLEGVRRMRKGGRGPSVFFGDFQAAYREAASAIDAATQRGVTVEQLADAMNLRAEYVRPFVRSNEPNE